MQIIKNKVTIINYEMGNIGSICNMYKYIGVETKVTNSVIDIESASRIILPGVGHFNKAMSNLNSLRLLDVIKKTVLINRVPILGICLGMQLMCNSSEEGNCEGLSLIDASVLKFGYSHQSRFKVPHMGWNRILIKKNSLILDGLSDISRFYFVHSYFVKCNQTDDILTTTNHDIDFVSGFQKENIFGVQFHPEKSHKFGVTLLSNFASKY